MADLYGNTTDLQSVLTVMNDVKTEVDTQTDLIAQIIGALKGKTAGSGGGGNTSGVEYEVLAIPAGTTSIAYTLPRVTHAFGALNNVSDMYFYFTTSANYKDRPIIAINGVVPTVIDSAYYSNNKIYVEGIAGFITYSDGMMSFPDGNVVWDLYVILVNDPNAYAISNGANNGSSSEPSLINFTIAGTSYQAEEGMTWGEWVDSEYNTGGFYISSNVVQCTVSGMTYVIHTDNISIKNTDKISANRSYYRSVNGGGSGGSE